MPCPARAGSLSARAVHRATYLACLDARHPGRIARTRRVFTGQPPATTAETAAGSRCEDMT
jgi:hypothetical protein